MVDAATRKYPSVLRMLAVWLHDSRPASLAMDFPFTSVSVNYAYAARKHRDGFNAGPSLTKAIGAFDGGRLFQWPDDDGRTALEALRQQDAIALDTKEFVLFDRRRAHEVEAFRGERYSLVSLASEHTGLGRVTTCPMAYPTPQRNPLATLAISSRLLAATTVAHDPYVKHLGYLQDRRFYAGLVCISAASRQCSSATSRNGQRHIDTCDS